MEHIKMLMVLVMNATSKMISNIEIKLTNEQTCEKYLTIPKLKKRA